MDDAYGRVNKIQNSNHIDFFIEHPRLFYYALKEYLRRLSFWKSTIGFETEIAPITIEGLFFDLATKINSNWMLSISEKRMIKYPDFLTDYDKKIIRNYINWEKRKNEDMIQTYLRHDPNLLSPYEPLIKLFEMGGGGIRRVEGGIGGIAGAMTTHIDKHQQKEPFVLMINGYMAINNRIP